MTTLALSRLDKADRPIVIASLFVLAILALGSVYTLATQGTLAFLRPAYLLQQLQVGSFLGIVAAGMMLVILWATSTSPCPGPSPRPP